MRELVNQVLSFLLVHEMQLVKPDGKTYNIKGYLQTISWEEYLAKAGIWDRYTVRGFFYPSYTDTTGNTFTVEEGDKIIAEGSEYLVVRVVKHIQGSTVYYIEAFMKGV